MRSARAESSTEPVKAGAAEPIGHPVIVGVGCAIVAFALAIAQFHSVRVDILAWRIGVMGVLAVVLAGLLSGARQGGAKAVFVSAFVTLAVFSASVVGFVFWVLASLPSFD
jgi:hypothetical protein